MSSYLPVNHLLIYLHQANLGLPHPTIIPADKIQVRHLNWSTLYFLSLPPRRWVIKIVHFPDQSQPEISWQSEELQRRGQREYASMQLLHQTFNDPAHPQFAAIPPVAYLSEINAIVMEYVDGVSIFDRYMKGMRFTRHHAKSQQAIYLAGQWLAQFHALSSQQDLAGHFPPYRHQDAANMGTVIQQYNHTLASQYGITPPSFPDLPSASPPDDAVWVHGDFHMRNVLVLSDERVLGFDTALEFKDSRAYDLGKFLADMKTRRQRILSQTLLPPPSLVEQWETDFLRGYKQLAGSATPLLPFIRLYERSFILQKWLESLAALPSQRLAFWVNRPFQRLLQR